VVLGSLELHSYETCIATGRLFESTHSYPLKDLEQLEPGPRPSPEQENPVDDDEDYATVLLGILSQLKETDHDQ
jgi:hypothetical protein